MIKLRTMQLMTRDLSPITETFSLHPRISPDDRGFEIAFEDEERGLLSPIVLHAKWPTDDAGPRWEGATLTLDAMERWEIGHNRWAAYISTHRETVAEFTGDIANAIQVISGYIASVELIPMPSKALPGVTFDYFFASAFEPLEEATLAISGVEIECAREGGVDSYRFADNEGRPYRVDFADGRAALYVSDVEVGSTNASRIDELEEMVRKSIASHKTAHKPTRYEARGSKP